MITDLLPEYFFRDGVEDGGDHCDGCGRCGGGASNVIAAVLAGGPVIHRQSGVWPWCYSNVVMHNSFLLGFILYRS